MGAGQKYGEEMRREGEGRRSEEKRGSGTLKIP